MAKRERILEPLPPRVTRPKRVVRVSTMKIVGAADRILKASSPLAVQEEARKSAPDALQALRDIINSDLASETAKLRAAEILLDRGYGRPKQTNLNVSVDDDTEPKKLSGAALRKRVEAALNGIEQAERGAEEEGEGTERPLDLRKFN